MVKKGLFFINKKNINIKLNTRMSLCRRVMQACNWLAFFLLKICK